MMARINTASLRQLAKRTFLYRVVLRRRHRQQIREWEVKGKPIPPPHLVKQQTVREYARRFSLKTLIETGTYLGEMVEASRDTFSAIYSIELDAALHEAAQKQFATHRHISILRGDSGGVLTELLRRINGPCLFWLDGHYSGGITAKGACATPIRQEIEAIQRHLHPGHVILIDDAHCFTGQNDYPTMPELESLIRRELPGWVFEVRDNIIRIHREPAA